MYADDGNASPQPAVAAVARQQWWMFATAFLAVDVLVVGGYLMHLTADGPGDPGLTAFSHPRWNGDVDGSVAEMAGQLQLLVTVVMLVFVARLRRAAIYLAWALILTAALLDDHLMLHELWGAAIAARWGLPEVAGLRPQDLGELAVWAGLALVLGAVLIIAHLRAAPGDRRRSMILLALMGLLAIFAVVVDMAHIGLADATPPVVDKVLFIVETAGELVPLTLILMAVHRFSLPGTPTSTAWSGHRLDETLPRESASADPHSITTQSPAATPGTR